MREGRQEKPVLIIGNKNNKNRYFDYLFIYS
jgi:hypothetical protein